MAHTSQSASQLSPQWRKGLSWSAIIFMGLIIVILAVLPLIVTAISYTNLFSSPAQNTTVTVSQMQELANKANQQLQQSNNLLNLVTSFATVMAVVLAILTVIAVGLGALGIITNNSVGELQKLIEEKGKAVDNLENQMGLKQKNIDELEATLHALGDKMKNQVDDVKKDFEKTNRALTLLILGNQLLEQRRREDALEYFEQAQELVPNDPRINYSLGRVYSGIEAYDKAIYFLQHATDLDQKFYQAQMELGLAYRRRGNQLYQEAQVEKSDERRKRKYSTARTDYQQAIKHLTDAINLQPDYVDALATLGGLHRRLGDYEHDKTEYQKALEFYEKAMKAEPRSSYALGNFASLSWYLGNQEEAKKAFARNKDIASERIDKQVYPAEIYWDYYDLGLAQLALGELEQAKDTYSKAIKLTPGPLEFEGVLSNLNLLNNAPVPIPGLEQIIKMVKEAENAKSVS